MCVSCSIEEPAEPSVYKSGGDDILATLETASETKVYADEEFHLHWTAADQISFFAGNTVNQRYRFNGKTGDVDGTFSRAGASSGTGSSITGLVAVYPYSSSVGIDADGKVTLTLPDVQDYATNTFGRGAFALMAVSEDYNMVFKALCGVLVIKLYGDKSISSVLLKGNDGELISGPASVTMPLGGTPSVQMAQNAYDTIELTCTQPVAVGASEKSCTEFWFAVPPVTFSKGFTVTITDSEGSEYTKSTGKSVTISRKHITKMSPLVIGSGAVSDADAVDLGLPSGVRWASCNLGASQPWEYGDYFYWGETEPRTDGGLSKWTIQGSNYQWSKYNAFPEFGPVDYKVLLDPEDDAATAKLGEGWRMPSKNEVEELLNLCQWAWTSLNGVPGYSVTGPNGNSIFLPAAGSIIYGELGNIERVGYYMSLSLNLQHCDYSWCLYFANPQFYNIMSIKGDPRDWPKSIRPVYAPPVVHVDNISINDKSYRRRVGDVFNLKAVVSPENATCTDVLWTSDNPDVVSVTIEGEAKALSVGTATITATSADGGKTSTTTVTVKPQTTEITIPEAVDLGLPSGLKWASFNVGASEIYELGNYYAWGETAPKDSYTWSNYKWCNGDERHLSKYNYSSEYGSVDNKNILDPEDDVAHVAYGGNWRMASLDEIFELQWRCKKESKTENGIEGILFTGPNGNSIFIPNSGIKQDASPAGSQCCFWFNRCDTSYPFNGCYANLSLNSNGYGGFERCAGLNVRAVCDASEEPEPDYVDLGLSVDWAACNVGADSPEETGDFYAWGETEPKTDYSWDSYLWLVEKNYHKFTKYVARNKTYGFSDFFDGKMVLDLEDDAAHAKLGDGWRMPTKAEFQELMSKCTWTLTTKNGVSGYLIEGNGNSIFLPKAGSYEGSIWTGGGARYWSSSFTDYNEASALFAYESGNTHRLPSEYRSYGRNVRPVREKGSVAATGVTLSANSLTLVPGQKYNLAATISPYNATERTLTWTSGNTSVVSVSADGVLTGAGPGSTSVTVRTASGRSASCSVSVAQSAGVQTPGLVDLGLSVKWATFNLGADNQFDSGDYFAWGETEAKSYYYWDSYIWERTDSRRVTKYCDNFQYGTVDGKTKLEAQDDPASAKLGSGWHTPTAAEWQELLDNCNWRFSYETSNFIGGYWVSGKKSGYTDKSIFIPLGHLYSKSSKPFPGSVGYYLSSSLYSEEPHCFRMLYMLDNKRILTPGERCYGYTVRPVHK